MNLPKRKIDKIHERIKEKLDKKVKEPSPKKGGLKQRLLNKAGYWNSLRSQEISQANIEQVINLLHGVTELETLVPIDSLIEKIKSTKNNKYYFAIYFNCDLKNSIVEYGNIVNLDNLTDRFIQVVDYLNDAYVFFAHGYYISGNIHAGYLYGESVVRLTED